MPKSRFKKIVVVTKKTALQELVERFGTRAQAKFYLEHMEVPFDEVEAEHAEYMSALETLKAGMPQLPRHQFIDRSFLPNFLFGDDDFVVSVGPDGLVVNIAKYLANQPIFAVNPDRERVDGILLPFEPWEFEDYMGALLGERFRVKRITMARAELNDGQLLYGFNDLFIGHRSHVSARYRIEFGNRAENHISSGIIISTGAGSTGWLKSVVKGSLAIAREVMQVDGLPMHKDMTFDWSSDDLYFMVREPFESKISDANIVFGRIEPGCYLSVMSHMSENGVIFSDGVEGDFMNFNMGAIASIGVAEKKAHLIVRIG